MLNSGDRLMASNQRHAVGSRRRRLDVSRTRPQEGDEAAGRKSETGDKEKVRPGGGSCGQRQPLV